MRSAALAALVAALLAASPAASAGEPVFRSDAAVLVAHEEHDHDHDHDHDADRDHGHDDDHHDSDGPTRREIRERKRALREEKRELKEREREMRRVERQRAVAPRLWLGVGAGLGIANVDLVCASATSGDCDEGSSVGTYSANITLTGPFSGVRLRGIRTQDKGDDSRTPYELAAMVGSRFGHSNWYGFIGAGRIQHPDDEFQGDTHGFAWEFVFAPASSTATGFELSFQGNTGEDVDFGLFNLGARFGKMR